MRNTLVSLVAFFVTAASPAINAIEPSSLDKAAVDALHGLRLEPHSAEWEYSGIIISHDGRYYFLKHPHTDRHHSSVTIPILPMPAGYTLEGMYHNHPCYPQAFFTEFFSPTDINTAYAIGVPSYVLDNCTGAVHAFAPGADKPESTSTTFTLTEPDGTVHHQTLSSGRVVGNTGDIGPSLSWPPAGEKP